MVLWYIIYYYITRVVGTYVYCVSMYSHGFENVSVRHYYYVITHSHCVWRRASLRPLCLYTRFRYSTAFLIFPVHDNIM